MNDGVYQKRKIPNRGRGKKGEKGEIDEILAFETKPKRISIKKKKRKKTK